MAIRKLASWGLKPLDWFIPTAKAKFMLRERYKYSRFDKGPILVLQMGKVGSRSVEAGLEVLVKDRPIYHSHFLSPDRVAETEKARRMYFRGERHRYLTRQWLSEFVLKTYRACKDDRTWKVVTITREPVGRNISAFFENLYLVPTGNEGEFTISSDVYGLDPMVVSVDDTDVLAELFFERARHDSPLKFFDREIRDIFGIDVIKSGFPIEKGYEIYRSGRVELLVLRLEDLSRCAAPAFSEFLQLDNFELVNRNIASQKHYASLYSAFKKRVDINEKYVRTLLDSDYMRTFYSEDEIRDAEGRWLAHCG
jgi:hypothetical protein